MDVKRVVLVVTSENYSEDQSPILTDSQYISEGLAHTLEELYAESAVGSACLSQSLKA